MCKEIDIDENNRARLVTEKYDIEDGEQEAEFLMVNYKALLSVPNYVSKTEKIKRRLPIIHFMK